MSPRQGRLGDGTAANRKSVALGITIAMVAVVALSIPVGYVMAGTTSATGAQGQSGDAVLQTGAQGNYSVHQGENCTEVVPLAGTESVVAFYDYQTPFATNAYTNTTGDSYSSEGTTELQASNTSVLFLYVGPSGNLSLVGVHGALDESSVGGAVSFDVSGLPEDGRWAVKDDEYDHETSIDNWTHEDGSASIDWTWGPARTDGFAFEGLGETFNVTIEPGFNENATLFGQQYDGTVENWTLVSNVSKDASAFGTATTYNRTVLSTSQNVTVTAGTCDALSSATPTPADGVDRTPEETDEPVGGGAETPEVDDDPDQEAIEAEPPDDETEAPDDETETPDGETEEDADDDAQELDSIDLEIQWETIGPEESIPVTVTADYGDSTEDVSDEAEITSSDTSVATVDGASIQGVSPGDVEITATFDGESDTESVSVEDNEPDSELEGLELQVGTTQLSPGGSTTVTVQADTAVGEQDVTGDAELSSDSPDVVSVQGSNLQANGEGEATITADYLDGSDTVTVTVAGADDGGEDGADDTTEDGDGDESNDEAGTNETAGDGVDGDGTEGNGTGDDGAGNEDANGTEVSGGNAGAEAGGAGDGSDGEAPDGEGGGGATEDGTEGGATDEGDGSNDGDEGDGSNDGDEGDGGNDGDGGIGGIIDDIFG